MVPFRQSSGVGNGVADDVAQRANDLYWNSDASVNRLAHELDLSKGSLYEILAPYPAGIPCPCGEGELTYANRTAREKGFVSCGVCALEEEESRVRASLGSRGLAPELQAPRTPTRGSAPRLETLLLGSALIGVAAGLALATLFRRR